MTEEPYRWLEAIGNRREYIREQLKDTTPVFAFSRPEGIVLVGVGRGMSKVFEIYDRHAYAALGHPVDIEKVRQSAIEAAHLEGFNRSSKDVTLRRLVGFALSPTLKNSFEQIFSPPIMVEAIFAEVGDAPEQDVLVRVHYDGNHNYDSSGVLVAHVDPKIEEEAANWLRSQLRPGDSVERVMLLGLSAWHAAAEGKPWAEVQALEAMPTSLDGGRVMEAALLDRSARGPVHYRPLTLSGHKP